MTWGAFYCDGGGGDRADRVRLCLEGIPSYFNRAPGDRCRAPLADRWGCRGEGWGKFSTGLISFPQERKTGGGGFPHFYGLLGFVKTPRGSGQVYMGIPWLDCIYILKCL